MLSFVYSYIFENLIMRHAKSSHTFLYHKENHKHLSFTDALITTRLSEERTTSFPYETRIKKKKKNPRNNKKKKNEKKEEKRKRQIQSAIQRAQHLKVKDTRERTQARIEGSLSE